MQDSTEERQTLNRMSFKTLSTILALVIGLGFAGGFLGAVAYNKISGNAQDGHGSKIAVLRSGDYIKSLSGNGELSENSANDVLEKMRRDANELAKKGFIVLDESAILAAPGEYSAD